MDSLLFGLTLVVIFIFWLWDAFRLMFLWGEMERAKNWPSTSARLIGIAPTFKVTDKSKTNIFYRMVRVLFGKRAYNVFAKMNYGDIEIGVYKISLYSKFNRHCLMFCRRLERAEVTDVDVYYNPELPHEAVLIPPRSHKIKGACIWLGIKTFALTIVLLYLFV